MLVIDKKTTEEISKKLNNRIQYLVAPVSDTRIGAVHSSEQWRKIVYWHTTGSKPNPVRDGFTFFKDRRVMLKLIGDYTANLLGRNRYALNKLNMVVKDIYSKYKFKPRKDGKTALTDKVRILRVMGAKLLGKISKRVLGNISRIK